MKKRNILIIFAILFLIILLGIILYYFGFISQSVIQGSYTCPENKICLATPVLHCNYPQAGTKVILRTNAPNFNKANFGDTGTWIAIDSDGDGSLEGYVRGTTKTNCIQESSTVNNLFNRLNIGIDYIYERNGEIYVCYSSTSAFKYEKTSLAVTSINPTEPYKSNGQEKYGGDLYSCSQDIFIDEKLKDTLDWGKDYPTSDLSPDGFRGSTYTLQSREKIKGEGTGVIEFEYVVTDIPITTCIVNIDGEDIILQDQESICQNKYLKVTCTEPPSTIEESPPNSQAICIDGDWKDAYNLKVNLEKSIITLGESFKIDFELTDTTSRSNREISAYLYDGSRFVDSDSGFTDMFGKTYVELKPDSTGYNYKIIMNMAHPEGDYDETLDELGVTDIVHISTFKTQSPQYDNDLIKVIVEVKKGDNYVDIQNEDIIAKYNGITTKLNKKERINTGVYHYSYDLAGVGRLLFKIRVQSDNYWTDYTEFEEIEVRKAGILFKDIDMPFSVYSGSHSGTFVLTDSSGNEIENANVKVIVTDQDGDISNPVVEEKSNGKYSFTHTYVDSGNYYIDIEASKGDLVGTSQSIPVNILGRTDEPTLNWLIWVIGIGLVLMIGFFIYLIVRRRK